MYLRVSVSGGRGPGLFGELALHGLDRAPRTLVTWSDVADLEARGYYHQRNKMQDLTFQPRGLDRYLNIPLYRVVWYKYKRAIMIT